MERNSRPVTPAQSAILSRAALTGGTAHHLLFSALIDGPLNADTVSAALRELAARHSSLRTSFNVNGQGEWTRHIHEGWVPPLRQSPVPLSESDPVASAQATLAAASPLLIGQPDVPPIGFFLTSDPVGRSHVLSLLAHSGLLDAWSVGTLWRELAGLCAGDRGPVPADEGQDAVVARHEALESSGRIGELVHEYAQRLADAPGITELPTASVRPQTFDPSAARLVFELSADTADSCDDLARALGVPRNAVLLAAWVLVLARWCGVDDLLVGVPVTSRAGYGHRHVVGQCSDLLPVRCRLEAGLSAGEYLRRTAAGLTEAARFSDAPFTQLVQAMRLDDDARRHPLVQFGFDAHDELIPGRLQAGDVTLDLTEGHCGGSLWDAMLSVQRWGSANRLALEYATATLAPAEAAGLAESLESALLDLSTRRSGLLTEVSTVSARQAGQLRAWGRGPAAPADSGLWTLLSRRASNNAPAPAVCAGDVEVTYQELIERAEALAVRLHAAGTGRGDHVLVDMPCGLAEIVSVLAVIRLGAVYVAVDRQAPAAQRRDIVARLDPRALLVSDSQAAPMRPHVGSGCAVVDATLMVSATPGQRARLPEPPADPDSPLYVCFTSGSTGQPKGVRVPQRGVVRLVLDADCVRQGPGERFLRLSPLAFDASVLEIFATLVGGACLQVFTADPVIPGALAQFIAKRRITALWLTAGLFRLMADHYPAAFATVRQVLTGGDVVPAEQVRALSELHDGLRITNGYGPTENTTFTTVYHVDSPADVAEPLPIGRPIQGTDVLVVDDTGAVVPPGAIGELWAGGHGLALDYLGDEAATREAFVRVDDRTMYRTGDLVRWDGLGRLLFAGRRDRQVKIGGHRVEPVAIERVLRGHPGVKDAVVVIENLTNFGPRLLAGVIPGQRGLSEGELRDFVSQQLPSYAVPALWALVELIPLTGNGKVDVAALRHQATAAQPAVQ